MLGKMRMPAIPTVSKRLQGAPSSSWLPCGVGSIAFSLAVTVARQIDDHSPEIVAGQLISPPNTSSSTPA